MINISDILATGENSKQQFKERLHHAQDIAAELVAFCNSRGGDLIVGVNDKTSALNPLSYVEVQETTTLLGNIASENIIPAILLNIETLPVQGGSIIVAHVKEGLNKPYRDNKGIAWVKNGADKRKVVDNVEIAEMMTDCGSFAPDEATVAGATLNDLNAQTIKQYLSNKFSKVLDQKQMWGDKLREATLDEVCNEIVRGHDAQTLLRNLRLIRPDGGITVAAMLLFGKYTQRWLPSMTAKCFHYVGNSVGGTVYADRVNDEDIEGNLLHQFEVIMSFFSRNLRYTQKTAEFNQQGAMEIPYASLTELVVNALVHRSLNLHGPIRVFIFDNRVEIHSPGGLPNGLSVEDIKTGVSIPRNNFLFSHAIHLLPYTGAGSGIQRALDLGIDVQFVDKIHEVVTIINRDEVLSEKEIPNPYWEAYIAERKTNQVSNQVSNQVDASKGLDIKVLTGNQRDVYNFCSVPRTAQEILDRLGLTNQSKNKKRYILPLVEMGYLELTNPENKRASNQKYRRVKR